MYVGKTTFRDIRINHIPYHLISNIHTIMDICCFSKEKLPNVLIPPKVLELERERALKWGKMLRNWEKFQGSEIVSIYNTIKIIAMCYTM